MSELERAQSDIKDLNYDLSAMQDARDHFKQGWDDCYECFQALQAERDDIEYQRGYYAQAIYQLSQEGNHIAADALKHVAQYLENKKL